MVMYLILDQDIRNINSLLITNDKYQGTINASIKTMWMHNIMVDFRIPFKKSNLMYCENQSAIQHAKNYVSLVI